MLQNLTFARIFNKINNFQTKTTLKRLKKRRYFNYGSIFKLGFQQIIAIINDLIIKC